MAVVGTVATLAGALLQLELTRRDQRDDLPAPPGPVRLRWVRRFGFGRGGPDSGDRVRGWRWAAYNVLINLLPLTPSETQPGMANIDYLREGPPKLIQLRAGLALGSLAD